MGRSGMMLNSNAKFIRNRLALRMPQEESLARFQTIVELLSLSKTPDLKAELEKIHEAFPTLTSFEREFPSVCFALATGIGKTRLMGALIAYLHYEKGVRNFFVMAPNLTIYKKLKIDLGDANNPKYVFPGLDRFVNPPFIVDGENYEEFRQGISGVYSDVVINVFNISKLNSESGRMRRLNEVLGQSYFDYLRSLPDLCIMMDESHHYHADRGFETINDLHPILGVELTATPQIQKGSKKIDFENVVYEYSLAHALNDELFIKVPVVFTRKDFRPEEYTPDQLDREKLNDGIRLHEETKSRLDVYGRTFGKRIVKPFVLVVAKDTNHSREIREYLTSESFFNGYYKDKVLEINSALRGSEKDENIELLLSLEKPENRIEIVIHVNMLKEGWDVTNLYTIIPLRASASETLTEQTIGRGLRLPYGVRTGEDEIDRLSIVSHDRYEAIVNLANDPNSLVRRVCYIIPGESAEGGGQSETKKMDSLYDEMTTAESFAQQLAFTLHEEADEDYIGSEREKKYQEVAQFAVKQTSKAVMELNKHVKTLGDVKAEENRALVRNNVITEIRQHFPGLEVRQERLIPMINQAIEMCEQVLIDHVIPIPVATIQPSAEVRQGFHPFTLDMRNITWRPSDDTLIGTELKDGGETFALNTGFGLFPKVDTVENEIARHIIVHDNVDYVTSSDLIYSLINDVKTHFLTYLNSDETEKVMRGHQRALAEIIYAQMNEHFYKKETGYSCSNVRPFSRIETSFGGKIKADDLYDLKANLAPSEVKSKIFKGFKKACHSLYKFDSDTERRFAIVLENDNDVIRWMRPSPKQFNIYYGPAGTKRYEPDFIVETADMIYMAEPKATTELHTDTVKDKAAAGCEYCRMATEWNAGNGGKPWRYILIAHDEIRLNSSFAYLVDNGVIQDELPVKE